MPIKITYAKKSVNPQMTATMVLLSNNISLLTYKNATKTKQNKTENKTNRKQKIKINIRQNERDRDIES